MKNPKTWCVAVLVGCLCFLVGNVVAQEEEGGQKPAAGMGGMPEHMKLTAEHENFKKMVGQWDSSWELKLPPMKGTGTATTKLILNGRFVRQDYESEMMGQPWQGVLHIGYDTVAKEFVSVWMESMSPIMAVSRGKRQADGSLRLIGTESDPMTGQRKKVAVVTRWLNDNQYTVAFYNIGDDGKETRAGLITYTRK